MGLSRGLNPGSGIVNISPDSYMGEGSFILPDGTNIRVLTAIGWTGDKNANQSLYDEYIIDSGQYGGLLAQFGFGLSDLDGKTCLRGTNGSLIFFLYGSNGQDVTPPNNTYLTTKLPGRVLIVWGNQAYVFQYLGAMDVHEEPPQYGPDGEYVAPGGDFTDSVCYNISSVRNRFGDSIDFTYGGNQFDYTATLNVNGVPTTHKIQVTLDSLTPTSVAIPDLNLTQEQASLGVGSYLSHGLIKDAVIHVKYLSDSGVVSSYQIKGKLDDPSLFLNLYNAGDSHEGPGLRYCRDYIQFESIKDETTNYGVSFDWQWSSFHCAWAGGQDLGVATLADVQCANGEKIAFTYLGDNFVDASFPSLWEGFCWGVTSVTRTDTRTGTSRVTNYSRKVPHATNWWPGTHLTWTNTDCWEAETLPDGNTIVRRYYPAVGSPDPGLRGSWIQQLSNLVQDRLYKSSLVFEERDYAPGADWRNDITNESLSTTANRIRFYDCWDTRSHFPVTDNSYAVMTLEVFQGGGLFEADAFYPTRTIDWDKEKGVAQVDLAYNWDPSSAQWSDIHKTTVQTTDPWGDLNYHFDRFSDACIGVTTYGSATAFPAGAIDRVEHTTYRPLDNWFVMGDWTSKSFTQNEVTRLPSIIRTSILSNGITLSETIGGVVTKQFTYPSDSAGVPSSQKWTGNGLPGSGLVGFSYGYDPTYNQVSISSLSPSLTSVRTIDSLGNVTSVKGPDGIIERYGWDTLGRILSISPSGTEAPTSFDYDDDFRSVTVTRNSNQRSLYYNAFGEPIRETRLNPDGSLNYRVSGYDSMGRKIWETIWQSGPGSDSGWSSPTPPPAADGSGPIPASSWTYDSRGRVIQEVSPTGEVQSITYSGLSRSVTENPGGADAATTIFHSDLLGRLISVTDALSQTTTYSYDGADRLIQVIQADPITHATQSRNWEYDSLGRLIKLIQPESGTTSYGTFTVDGKPTVTIYGAGSASPRTVRTSYDGLGRVLSMISDDGSVNLSYSYDESGHGASEGKLTSASSSGITKGLIYDGLNGRLSTVTRTTNGQTFTQNLSYDTLGNVASRTYPDGRIQTFTYDPMRNLPSGSSFNGGSLGSFVYDPASWQLTGFTAGNNASSVFGYVKERLSSVAHFIPGKVLAAWSFQYDGRGNLKSDGEDVYSYDPLNRLVRSLIRDPQDISSTDGIMQTVGYDAFGNRSFLATQRVTNWTGSTVPTTPAVSPLSTSDHRDLRSYAMNSGEKSAMASTNHLPSSVGGVATGALYDPQGNLTQFFRVPGDGSTQVTMTYDALGRVTSLADAARPGIQERYYYDDDGLRTVIEIWQNGSLQKREFNIYNEARQLVAQYEWVLQ